MNKKTYPDGTTFKHQTFGADAAFGRDCDFVDCTFRAGTTFGRNCDFFECTIGGVSAFGRNSTFKGCEFTGENIEFWSNCRFAYCKFAECTSFGAYSRFKDCRFPPRVSFGYGCEFDGVNHGLIDALASEKKRTDEQIDEQIAKLIGGAK